MIALASAGSDVAAFVESALDAAFARAPAGAVARVTVAAPVADPLALPAATLSWEPPEGLAIAGRGAAATLRGEGAARFCHLRAGAAQLWKRVVDVCEPGAGGVPARLFGGLAFATGDGDPAWRDFGDALFVLPRLCYAVSGERAHLSIATTAAERAGAGDEVATALGQLECGAAVSTELPGVRGIAELPPASWRARIDAIRAAIAAGALDKVVAARRSEVELAAPPSIPALLRLLRQRHPVCTRFSLRAGDAVFVAATPERLVERRGARVVTEALAGSIAADADVAALLGSDKDRREQAVVVRAIAEALSPLCAELEVAPTPRPRHLRDVVHLETRIAGTLARPTHVLELVQALHPTPAVGGAPRDKALSWIAGAEEGGRGWYAGPVGWLDAEGDGELVVAIRSGLFRGARASLYAGAGIVADSEADAEYAETGLKLRALLGALGATP